MCTACSVHRKLLIGLLPCFITGEALDAIVMEALGMDQPAGENGSGPGFLTQLSRTVGSMQKFMKQLSN